VPLRSALFLVLPPALVAVPPPEAPVRAERPTQDLFVPQTGQHLALSVLEPDEAQELFKELAGRRDIPHRYLADGNYARAHKMVWILEDQGVVAAKVWATGEFYLDWAFGEAGLRYHVAPLVYVRGAGRVAVLRVLDPSLFDQPVTYQVWKAKLLAKAASKLEGGFFTSRFAYDPDERNAPLTAFSEESLRDMNAVNQDSARRLFMAERLKGAGK
jgi:hypothetical protein